MLCYWGYFVFVFILGSNQIESEIINQYVSRNTLPIVVANIEMRSFGMINLQYEIRICQKIYDRVTMKENVCYKIRWKRLYNNQILVQYIPG